MLKLKIGAEVTTKADALKLVDHIIKNADEFAQIKMVELAKSYLAGSPLKLTEKQIQQMVEETVYNYCVECKLFCVNGIFYSFKKLPKPYIAEAKKLIEEFKQSKAAVEA